MTPLDALYAIAAVLAAPKLLGKKREGWGERFGKGDALPAPSGEKPRVLLHAVSVGEAAALRTLVDLLVPRAEVIITATTDTGLARARALYADRCEVLRYPLDFSWSVRRFLERVRPGVVGLTELEVWPQFVGECRRRGVPVAVINGRLSERSFRGYWRARAVVRPMFRRLSVVLAQDEAYAERFTRLGAGDVRVAGSMKWDNARVVEDAGAAGVSAAAEALRGAMGIEPGRPLIVTGSTAPLPGTPWGSEEALLLRAVERVRTLGIDAQLLCAPRKPEHFETAAAALPGCVRRTARAGTRGGGDAPGEPSPSGLYLLDTIGELGHAYALADVVVIGRSFGRLYGSDPMEPVGLGRATIIGPRYGDFEQAVRVLREAGGMVVLDEGHAPDERLAEKVHALLAQPGEAAAMAERGLSAMAQQRGASARIADALLALMPERATPDRAMLDTA